MELITNKDAMKVLVVASANSGKFSPFVLEQSESLKKMGVEIEYLGIKGNGAKGYLSNRKQLISKIEVFKPHLVHAHFGLSGLLAVMQNRVPVITTFHNGETLSPYVNLLSSLGAIKAKHIVYVAEHIRRLSYYKAKHYSILPCGINLDDCKITPYSTARKELGFKDNKKYILFGGAFSNLRKNYSLLKEAVSLLPNSKHIICMEMKGMSRAECVLHMCASDVFCLPSKSEGSPQALKEAMACNCPIVATDIADIKHLLGNLDGHFICTFDPINVASQIARALEFQQRTNGRQRIISLGLTNNPVAEKLLTIYKDVICKSNPKNQ